METTIKNKKYSKSESKALQAYANDPYFIKKREASLKLLQKTNIPASFSVGKK